MKPIVHTEVRSSANEDMASVELTELFVSLLGAVAYALLTRIDIAVFVSCLQRVSHKCRIIHVKRLNAVLRYIQTKPRGSLINSYQQG